jgi:hypothetical protein
MSSCVKCTTCNKCSCKCTCVKEENKANWNWENFQKAVQGYHPPSKRANDEELAKRFSLILIDNNADEEWEIEYRTRVNVIEVANILMDYFGIEADAIPKNGFDIIGMVDTEFDDEEED